jgi:hypothetical protein
MRAGLLQLLCILTLSARSQTLTIGQIAFAPTDTLQGAYKPAKGRDHIFIASRFAKETVDQHKALDSVSGFLITEIVLVYSQYRKSDNFSQDKLNRGRWTNLLARYPSLFQSGTTVFRNVCQDGVRTDSVAKELNHGFYIYFENIADTKVRQEEISAISRMLDDLGVDTSGVVEAPEERIVSAATTTPATPRLRKPLKTKTPGLCRQPYYKSGMPDLDDFFVRHIDLTNRQKRNAEKVRAELTLRLDFNGQIRSAHVLSVDKDFIEQIRKALSMMSLWHPGVLNGIAVKTNVKIILQANAKGFVHVKGPLVLPRSFAKCGLMPDEEIFDYTTEKRTAEYSKPGIFMVEDETLVRNVVDRHRDLDSVLLVVDLTGSMGPYIAQVLDMMKAMVEKNDKRILSIALFNDGNGKPDKAKKIGSTGGIIILQGDITLDVLGDAVLKSMKKGSGGDVMENNLEAVLQGLSACKGCGNVMLVCDNFATPRDGILLPQVDRPIHWIICGAYGGINVNYLDLARQNKGIVHTGKSDVKDLHLVKENEIVSIDGFKYQLMNGKFRMVNVR